MNDACRAYLAEALGTFMLVLAGCGAIVINDVSGGVIGHAGIAATFGLIVLAVIYTLGDVSGAHINPAVTLAFWRAGRFPGARVAPYIASQIAGALLAALLLRAMFPEHATLGATLPQGDAWRSALLEFVLTWWLMWVILSVAQGAQEKGIVAGMVIGAVVCLEAMFAGPISGASMNPARSLGPALMALRLDDLWIYLSAPVAGALAAIPTCRLVHGRDCCSAQAAAASGVTS